MTFFFPLFIRRALAAAGVAALAFGAGTAAAQTEIKLGHVGEPRSLFTASAEEYAKRVNAKLAGKAQVVVFGSSQLGGDNEMLQKVKLAGANVHFGLIVTINLGIGQQTRPVASVLMVASSIAKASVCEVAKVNIWYIAVLLALLLLVTYVPPTGLVLVDLFYR